MLLGNSQWELIGYKVGTCNTHIMHIEIGKEWIF